MSGQDKSSEQAYYDNLFKTRKRFDQFQNGIYERLAQNARENTDGAIALDLGCGAGNQALELINQGFSVIAVDLSSEAVKLAEATVNAAGHSVTAINADAESLPLPDASVDACICGLLLHHFKSFEKVAEELHRVVRPGGVVVAIDANAHNPFCWLFFNCVHRLRPLSRLTPNQRALWRSEIKRVFSKNGFSNFQFDSTTSRLKQDWLGGSLGAKLNFYSRALVLQLSELVLPKICRGNMLISVFRHDPDRR